MFKKWMALLFSIFICTPVQALFCPFNDWKFRPNFLTTIGNHTLFPRTVQVNELGEVETFNWNPYASVGYFYDFNERWSLTPSLTLAMPKVARDESYKRYYTSVDLNGGYRWHYVMFKLGLGYVLISRTGARGMQELDNGEGRTEFFNPANNRTSYNHTYNFGSEVFMLPNLSVGLEFKIYSLWERISRRVGYLLSITYYFQERQGESLFNFGGLHAAEADEEPDARLEPTQSL